MSQSIKSFFSNKTLEHTFKLYVLVVIILALFSLVAINFVAPEIVLGLNIFIFSLIFLIEFPQVGIYLMVLLFPFLNWQFVWQSWNIPYVDLIAIMTLIALVFGKLLDYFHEESKTKTEPWYKSWPGLIFALAFFMASSLAMLHNIHLDQAMKYLLRPIIFFYLMFVVLPFNLIENKKQLQMVLKMFLASGLFVAFSGFLSVLLSRGPSWFVYRAVPFDFWGFMPMGGNHNAIAETLIVVIPLTIILYILSNKVRQRGLYILAILFMTFVLLLTFSRSGWLALLIELLILYGIRYKYKINNLVIISLVVLVILVPMVLYFTVWNQVDWIQSSNSNRLLLSGIAFDYFRQNPIIGNGLNTFQSIVGQTFIYKVEFGDPLESHGFVQKIATESGLLGLISFFALLGYFAFEYLRGFKQAQYLTNKRIITCFIMMFAGIVFFEIFSTSYFVSVMWLPIGVGLAGVKLSK